MTVENISAILGRGGGMFPENFRKMEAKWCIPPETFGNTEAKWHILEPH